MMGKRGTYGSAKARIGHRLGQPADFECPDSAQVDRAELVDEDEAVERLACVAGRDRNLARVLGDGS